VALKNVMKWANMIPGANEAITTVPVARVEEPHRFISYPFVPATGIIDYKKFPGDFFKKGDLLVVVRSLSGVVLGQVEAEMDGFVVVWSEGVAKYKGESLGFVAVLDAPLRMVFPWEEVDRMEERESKIDAQ